MPNIATVIPVMEHINKHLAMAVLNFKYLVAIQTALTMEKRTLNRYYDKSEVFCIAMGLFCFNKFYYISQYP
jgi:hypothetical protein